MSRLTDFAAQMGLDRLDEARIIRDQDHTRFRHVFFAVPLVPDRHHAIGTVFPKVSAVNLSEQTWVSIGGLSSGKNLAADFAFHIPNWLTSIKFVAFVTSHP